MRNPGPDEGVVGRKRLAHRRVGDRLGDGERGLEQAPGVRRVHLAEGRLRAVRSAEVAAVLEQLADLRRDPAVLDHASGVVVDDHHERVLFLAGVAEDADHLVAVAVGVGADIAVARGDGAGVLGPARPGHPAFHQVKRGHLGLDGLTGRAQAGDTGQQRQRGGTALLRGVLDEALADQFLDVGTAPGRSPAAPAARSRMLAPPGSEQLAHHQLGVERAAHGEQLPRRPQHLGEEGVRRRRADAANQTSGRAGAVRAAWGIGASALRAHFPSFSDPVAATPRLSSARRREWQRLQEITRRAGMV